MKFSQTDFWFITELFMTGFVRPTPNDTVDGLREDTCVEVRQLCMQSAAKQLIDCKT
jgi:hypothetical protein